MKKEANGSVDDFSPQSRARVEPGRNLFAYYSVLGIYTLLSDHGEEKKGDSVGAFGMVGAISLLTSMAFLCKNVTKPDLQGA